MTHIGHERVDSLCRLAEEEYSKLDLEALSQYGIERRYQDYYLIALYPPLRALRRLEDSIDDYHHFCRSRLQGEIIDLYVHWPFCVNNCTFCHFYKKIVPRRQENGLEDAYIESLGVEIDQLRRTALRDFVVRSIQFGGGTPSTISCDGLRKLTGIITDRLDIAKDAIIKFELHPNSIHEKPRLVELLSSLKEFGLTGLAIDMETFNPQSLDAIHRGDTSYESFLEVLDVCRPLELSEIISAFIIGLPHETLESFAEMLARVVETDLLTTINMYPLMFKPGAKVTSQLETNPALFCAPDTRDKMEAMMRRVLTENGYSEGPMQFYSRGEAAHIKRTMKAKPSNLVGIGAASFGYLKRENHQALEYMNIPDVASYIERARSGQPLVWRMHVLDNEDQARRQLILGMDSCRNVSKTDLLSLHGFDVEKEHAREIDLFQRLGLIHNDANELGLTYKGRFRNSEVLFHFAKDSARRWNPEDPEIRQLRTLEFFPNISEEIEMRLRRSLRP